MYPFRLRVTCPRMTDFSFGSGDVYQKNTNIVLLVSSFDYIPVECLQKVIPLTKHLFYVLYIKKESWVHT